MTRFGALVERIDKRVPGSELPLLSVSQTRGVIRRSELTGAPARAESLDHYKTCERGDIVFNKMSIRVGAMGVAHEAGLVTYHYEVMRPRPGVDPRFVVYLMKSDEFTSEMIRRERGIGAGDDSGAVRTTEVPYRVLRTIDTHVPSPAAQRAIADYLDRETQQIDAFIAKNEELIALLTERRAAAIVAAIGEHDTTPLKYLVSPMRPLTYGILQVGAHVDDGVPYLLPADLSGEGSAPRREALGRTTAEIAAPYSRSIVKSGDLVITIGPGYGRVAVIGDELDGVYLTRDTVRIAARPEKVDVSFLAWVLSSRMALDFWDRTIQGSTFRRLNIAPLAQTPIPLPPLDEQARAVSRVEAATKRVDVAISVARDAIKLARERRAALVSAAVAGRVEMTEAV